MIKRQYLLENNSWKLPSFCNRRADETVEQKLFLVLDKGVWISYRCLVCCTHEKHSKVRLNSLKFSKAIPNNKLKIDANITQLSRTMTSTHYITLHNRSCDQERCCKQANRPFSIRLHLKKIYVFIAETSHNQYGVMREFSDDQTNSHWVINKMSL